MSKMQAWHGGTISRLPVWRIVAAQWLALVVLGAGLWVAKPAALFPVLAGGMIEVFARAWFGYWAFRYVGASRSRLVLKAFRWGEVGKFVLVAVSFGLLFVLHREIAVIGVVAGYGVTWLVGTVATAILVSRYRASVNR